MKGRKKKEFIASLLSLLLVLSMVLGGPANTSTALAHGQDNQPTTLTDEVKTATKEAIINDDGVSATVDF